MLCYHKHKDVTLPTILNGMEISQGKKEDQTMYVHQEHQGPPSYYNFHYCFDWPLQVKCAPCNVIRGWMRSPELC